MKKVNRINVTIGRFGVTPIKIELQTNSTVEDALEEANISLNSGEKCWINGEKALQKDIVEEGDTLNIVGSKEGGL